jgi:hypothetical protein
LGVAYQLNDKTVVRAGGAVFFSFYQFGAATPDAISSLDGFTPTTPWFSTYQNAGAIPGTNLSNPWPTGLLLPTGSSLGALTNVGLGVSGGVDAPGWDNQPYLQAWNFGIQRTLPGNILLDVNYVGQKGTHLMYAGYTSLQYLGPWAEQLIGNPTPQTNSELTALTSYVNNPFSGIITNPASCLSGPQVPAWTLQIPNPQFCGENFVEPPWSNTNYNALQIRVEKRLSHGLQFLANYTWSKSLDDTSCNGDNVCWIGGFTRLEDPNNRRKLPYSQSEFNVPQILNLSYVYHLPVGRGMHWGSGMNRWADGVLGGWETTGIWVFASGQPLSLSWISCGVTVPSYGCQQPNLIGKLQKTPGPITNNLNNYFSNEATALAEPAPYSLGTGPPVMSGILGPGTFNANLALFKNFNLGKMREGSSLQFRIETINGFNHPNFAQPNTTFESPNFGIITSQLNAARQVQLGLKLYY